MTRPALKLAAAPLSPEREALADAIAEAAPKRADADAARSRSEAARGALALALSAVPAAERAAEAERSRLVSNPGGDKAEMRRLRSVAVDAADDLAIAKDISARADAAEIEAERLARYGAEAIERNAAAVIAGAFPVLIDAAERAARDAAALAFAAHFVGSNGNAFDGEASRMEGRAASLNPRFAFGSDGAAADAARQAAQAPWRAARVALLSDPAAPLPEV